MSLEDYADDLRAGRVPRSGDALPPHWPSCFGCGPDNPAGLQAVARRVGDEIRCTYAFRDTHEGAPGIAHGGAVAALLDDVAGFLLFVVRAPAVTRALTVDYLVPVRIGTTYELAARVDRREGRKLFISVEALDPAGAVAFRGTGLFLVVDMSHFSGASSPIEGVPPTAL